MGFLSCPKAQALHKTSSFCWNDILFLALYLFELRWSRSLETTSFDLLCLFYRAMPWRPSTTASSLIGAPSSISLLMLVSIRSLTCGASILHLLRPRRACSYPSRSSVDLSIVFLYLGHIFSTSLSKMSYAFRYSLPILTVVASSICPYSAPSSPSRMSAAVAFSS